MSDSDLNRLQFLKPAVSVWWNLVNSTAEETHFENQYWLQGSFARFEVRLPSHSNVAVPACVSVVRLLAEAYRVGRYGSWPPDLGCCSVGGAFYTTYVNIPWVTRPNLRRLMLPYSAGFNYLIIITPLWTKGRSVMVWKTARFVWDMIRDYCRSLARCPWTKSVNANP